MDERMYPLTLDGLDEAMRELSRKVSWRRNCVSCAVRRQEKTAPQHLMSALPDPAFRGNRPSRPVAEGQLAKCPIACASSRSPSASSDPVRNPAWGLLGVDVDREWPKASGSSLKRSGPAFEDNACGQALWIGLAWGANGMPAPPKMESRDLQPVGGDAPRRRSSTTPLRSGQRRQRRVRAADPRSG